jgi:AraC family transcriptional regulator
MPSPGPVVASHTFGSIVRGRDLGGLSVEEVLMPPGLSVPEHGHEGAQIYFLLEGFYSETAHQQRHELSPGATWFRPPRALHSNEVLGSQPALALILTVEADRLRTLERHAERSRALHSILLDEVRREMLREIRRGDETAVTALEGWALLLLARTERELGAGSPSAPKWLSDAVEHIRSTFQEPLSLSAVASHVGVHPATLAAAFRRHLHTSVGEYVRELRLRHGRAALLESRKPIQQIAVEAGFFDQAHFGRWFVRRFGVTPAVCRALGVTPATRSADRTV